MKVISHTTTALYTITSLYQSKSPRSSQKCFLKPIKNTNINSKCNTFTYDKIQVTNINTPSESNKIEFQKVVLKIWKYNKKNSATKVQL